MDGPRLSAEVAPSIWKADVDTPQMNPSGKAAVLILAEVLR
jgi:hypothetical protein